MSDFKHIDTYYLQIFTYCKNTDHHNLEYPGREFPQLLLPPPFAPGSSGSRRCRTFKRRCLRRCINWVKEGLRVLTQLQFGTCWKLNTHGRWPSSHCDLKGQRGPVKDSSFEDWSTVPKPWSREIHWSTWAGITDARLLNDYSRLFSYAPSSVAFLEANFEEFTNSVTSLKVTELSDLRVRLLQLEAQALPVVAGHV